MLSFNRNSLGLVFARAIALLATTAFLALAAAGCGTVDPDACVSLSFQCPVIQLSTLCPANDSCTIDDQPASCTQSTCTLSSPQKLTIPLDGISLTKSTPDLMIHFANLSILKTDVHVVLDGTEVKALDRESDPPYFVVKWGDTASSPKKLEISFTSGPKPIDVGIFFKSIQCEADKRASCGGGA